MNEEKIAPKARLLTNAIRHIEERKTRGETEPGSARLGSARYTYKKKSQKARLGLGSVTSWLAN